MNRLRHILTWCLCFTLLLAVETPAFGQSGAVYDAAELAKSTSKSPSLGSTVQCRGVVTWINPLWHSCLVSTPDENRSILVEFTNASQMDSLVVGRYVDVSGVLLAFDYRRYLKNAKVLSIGDEGLDLTPLPLPANFDIASVQTSYGRRIALKGTVEFVNQRYRRYVIWIAGHGTRFRVECHRNSYRELGRKFAGAEVEVAGMLVGTAGATGHAARVVVNSLSDIKIVTPGTLPKDTDADLFGVVSCKFSEDSYLIRDEANGNVQEIKIRYPEFIQVGDSMRYTAAKGKPSRQPDWISVQSSLRYPIRSSSQPKQVNGEQPLLDGEWVTLQGVIRDIGVGSNRTIDVLCDGHLPLRISLLNITGDLNDLQPSDTVEIVGYARSTDSGITIYPTAASDIRVVRRVPWYLSQYGKLTLCVCATLLFAGLSNIGFLRWRIHRRTQELRRSSRLITATFDSVREGICLMDANGCAQSANRRFWSLFDLTESEVEEVHGSQLCELLSSRFDDPSEFRRLWQSGGTSADGTATRLQLKHSGREVSLYKVVAAGDSSPDGMIVWVVQDITQQRQLEDSLMQAQKIESVGRIAGGLAHDFNNALAGISGNLAVIKASLDQQPLEADLETHVDAAEFGVFHAADLVKNLLGYSRQSTLVLKIANVNEVIYALKPLVTPLLASAVQLDIACDQDLWLTRFDRTKLEQVLINLVVNANDAISKDGGIIRITTRNTQRSSPATQELMDCVEIAVIDNGCGMPPEIRKQIFEPFFSTKSPGRGSGLGLATSMGIVEQLGGWITCESELGQGSSFYINLRASSIESSSHQPLQPMSVGQQLDTDQILALCVDDDELARRSLQSMLKLMGIESIAACDGQEALDILDGMKSNGTVPQLIFLDSVMPRLSGPETLPILRQRHPALPVIMCTGFVAEAQALTAATDSRLTGFLQKPFRLKELQDATAQALNRNSPPAAKVENQPVQSP